MYVLGEFLGFITLMMFVGNRVCAFSYLGIQDCGFCKLCCSLFMFLVVLGFIALMMFVYIKVWIFTYLCIQVCVFFW